MEGKNQLSGTMKIVIVSGITAVIVFFVLSALAFGVYFFMCCKPIAQELESSRAQESSDKPKRAGRTAGPITDASKVTSISFGTWSHAGPLYPGPNDPPGYVSSKSVEFRRDLTAYRESKRDYDRDLPDEGIRSSGTLTAEQFEKLATICAESDIVNEPDSTKTRTEGAATLVIGYGGEKKSIVTSNVGIDTEEVKKVLAAIEQLEKSVKWAPLP